MEVRAQLKFTTPCLGAVRSPQLDTMLRDAAGNVIFMQSWWRFGLSYAAKVLNTNVKAVDEIQVDPKITGKLGRYERYYRPKMFTAHEAYEVGTEIEASFCLPNEISIDQFRELLETAGRFVGISPYGYKQDFGRFEVVSVKPAR